MTHQIVHLQVVGGQPSRAELEEIGNAFARTLQDPDRGTNIITTPDNVKASIMHLAEGNLPDRVTIFPTLTPLDIARVCHEVNRAYCTAIGDSVPVVWEEAGEAQHNGLFRGVTMKLNKSLTAEQQHEAWCQSKHADGWTYGPTKDEQKKEHPNLVPYGELSEVQQVKDHLFGAVVNNLRPFLAKPSSEVRQVVIDGVTKSFLELRTGDIFNFDGDEKQWVALNDPYIGYFQNDAQYTIDVREPTASEFGLTGASAGSGAGAAGAEQDSSGPDARADDAGTDASQPGTHGQ